MYSKQTLITVLGSSIFAKTCYDLFNIVDSDDYFSIQGFFNFVMLMSSSAFMFDIKIKEYKNTIAGFVMMYFMNGLSYLPTEQNNYFLTTTRIWSMSLCILVNNAILTKTKFLDLRRKEFQHQKLMKRRMFGNKNDSEYELENDIWETASV